MEDFDNMFDVKNETQGYPELLAEVEALRDELRDAKLKRKRKHKKGAKTKKIKKLDRKIRKLEKRLKTLMVVLAQRQPIYSVWSEILVKSAPRIFDRVLEHALPPRKRGGDDE